MMLDDYAKIKKKKNTKGTQEMKNEDEDENATVETVPLSLSRDTTPAKFQLRGENQTRG